MDLKKIILLIALLLGQEYAFSYDVKSIELYENKVDVANVALDLAKEFYPELDVEKYLGMIDAIAEQVKTQVRDSKIPSVRIEAINRIIYEVNGFSYDFSDTKVSRKRNRYLNGLLDTKKGSCITLTLLYVIIGQRLRYPIYPVIVPTHFFVRYIDSKDSFNVETTKGIIVKNERYIEDFSISRSSIQLSSYMREMSYKEYVSELVSINAIDHFYKNNDYERGLEYMDIAVKLRPITPDIYYSKGKMHFFLHKNYQSEGKSLQSDKHLVLSRKLYSTAKTLVFIKKSRDYSVINKRI